MNDQEQHVAPWTFGEAHLRSRQAEEAQEAAEEALVEAYRDAAKASYAYTVALAKKIVALHDVEGLAWSVCGDMARGDPEVARLRGERDISEGKREAMIHAAWRHKDNRKDTDRFIDWSMRRELAHPETGGERERRPS